MSKNLVEGLYQPMTKGTSRPMSWMMTVELRHPGLKKTSGSNSPNFKSNRQMGNYLLVQEADHLLTHMLQC